MASIEATVECRMSEDGEEIVVALTMPLEFEEPVAVTTGRRDDAGQWISQGVMWHPWSPMEFEFAPEVFIRGGLLTLAVALKGYTPEPPEWRGIPWIWQQTYRAQMTSHGPGLVEIK